MLRGETWSAAEMAGTAVFRMVVSSDSMKNATATSHGKICLLAVAGDVTEGALGTLGDAIDSASTLSAHFPFRRPAVQAEHCWHFSVIVSLTVFSHCVLH